MRRNLTDYFRKLKQVYSGIYLLAIKKIDRFWNIPYISVLQLVLSGKLFISMIEKNYFQVLLFDDSCVALIDESLELN